MLPPDAAFSSIATSSQGPTLGFAVQLQVTEPGDVVIFELDAPVIPFGTLTSHLCVHVGLESVLVPSSDGKSRTQLFEFFAVIDIVGLIIVPLFVLLVGMGFV